MFAGSFLEKEKSRIALWLPVSFAAGILLYFSLPKTPPLWLGFPGLLLFAVSAFLEFKVRKKVFISFFILFFALGFILISVRAEILYEPILPKKTKSLEITGVIDKTDISGSGQRLTFHHPLIEGMKQEETPAYIRVKVNTLKVRYKAGDTVRLKAVLMPPPMPSVPGGYDIPRKFYFQQLGATGYAVSKVTVLHEAEGLDGIIYRLRQSINFRFLQNMEKREAGVAMSLVTGEQGGNDKKLAEAYRSSGIAHILSVSGLHMSMLAALVFGVLRFILAFIPAVSLHYDTKKISAVVAIIVAFIYLLISGANIPAVRAFIMVLIVLLAVVANRRSLSMRSVAIAFMLILIIYPESIVSAGFQMSFAAVFALIATFETSVSHFHKRISLFRASPKKSKSVIAIVKNIFLFVISWIVITFITDFVASSATLPFCVYHFDRVAVYSFITNLITAPILGIIVMPFLLLGSLMMPFNMEGIFLKVAELGIYWINQTAFWVKGFDNSVYVMPAMPAWVLLCVTVGGFWLCLWKSKIRLLGFIPMGLIFLYPYFYTPPDVLASQGGKMFAVLSSDGKLMIEDGRANKMTRENWLSKNGQDFQKYNRSAAKKAWSEGYKDDKVSLDCSDKLCFYKTKGKTIAFAKDYPQLKEACAKSDVVFSTVNATKKYCAAPILIERRQMWQNGTYELKVLKNGEIMIRSSADIMGKHLWLKK